MVERHTEMADLHPDVIASMRERGIHPYDIPEELCPIASYDVEIRGLVLTVDNPCEIELGQCEHDLAEIIIQAVIDQSHIRICEPICLTALIIASGTNQIEVDITARMPNAGTLGIVIPSAIGRQESPTAYGLDQNVEPPEIDAERNLYHMHDEPIESSEIIGAIADGLVRAFLRNAISRWAVLNEEDILAGRWFDNTSPNTQVDNGEPSYGDVGGKPFDQAMAEWDALIKEARESE